MSAPLSLDRLIREKDNIFIMNNTPGIIILSIKDKAGRPQAFHVPNTFIPIEVTAKFSHDIISDSVDLRTAINNGSITLLEKEEAYEMLKPEAAQEEQIRLNRTTKITDRISRNDQSTEIKDGITGNRITTNPKILSLVAMCQEKTQKPKDALIRLRTLSRQLRKEDWSYLISQLNSTDGYDAVTQYATEQLSLDSQQSVITKSKEKPFASQS